MELNYKKMWETLKKDMETALEFFEEMDEDNAIKELQKSNLDTMYIIEAEEKEVKGLATDADKKTIKDFKVVEEIFNKNFSITDENF